MRSSPSLLSKLKKGRVVQLLIAYLVVLWLVIQGLVDFVPIVGLPDWTLRAVLIAGVAVIPVIILISWMFDLTPPRFVHNQIEPEIVNPELDWARRRHDNADAGFIELHWTDEAEKEKTENFLRAISIGRGPNNDLRLSSRLVSRNHAVVWAEDGAWRVRDLESANGTFINDQRIPGKAELPPACHLRLGPNGPIIQVNIEEPDETALAQIN